ncbi:glycerophosphodiester phosphodiesterase [Loigolactobacillus backii]|uniref:Uncharacterized protein n=1 Tax=Loigolactobacillus backii TaxID=375175 RepID=A0A192H1H3_9LACO|nr:glycerophosphodiester phosphodiesterase family protein [Loigolactobacillus backii]ANK62659.1 hypothetical protein AYR53_07660 [Loigolactobacillus backii]ANK64237.1 hypothetical protein AYR54_02530 [Loigolactobacillus backii]ANK67369.1 hypothetical protein AYR55_06510 [Loigolactobacillus backii]ANK70333.1 hypothetical protein AYR56_09345 [Loigolactobacillus backii]MDA5388814.1 glycerophosphodiester phosphodiesterase family protein [Loigolactobacillus backii]
MLKKLSWRVLGIISLLCCQLVLSGFTVVAHRGDPLAAPEETFQSFDDGFAAGASYCELDLRESSDGVLVVSHDSNLKRVTGQNMAISKTPFNEIQQAHETNGEPIHSLQQLFEHYANQPETKFILETKKNKQKPIDMEAKLAALINQYHMQDRVIIHSFSADSLQKMSVLLPNVPRLLLANDLTDISMADLQFVTGVSLEDTVVTPDIIKQIHHLNKKIYVWSEMTEPASVIPAITLNNVDGVVTNYPATVADYAQAKKGSHQHVVNKTATVTTTYSAATWTNPYVHQQASNSVTVGEPLQISTIVTKAGYSQAELTDGRWVNAVNLNFGANYQLARPYLGLNVQLKPNQYRPRLWNNPLAPTTSQRLFGGSGKITAVKVVKHKLWFQINQQGWLQSNQVLVNLTNQSAPQRADYFNLPAAKRLTSIDLLQSPALNQATRPTVSNGYFTRILNEFNRHHI